MNLIVNYSFSSIMFVIRFIIDYILNINEKRKKTIHDILDINIYIITFEDEFILNNTQNNEISQVLVYNNKK